MIKIWLIRHGMTEGNLKGRYIGRTDEHLCQEGKKALSELSYPVPDGLFISPMIRCRETAEILFPGKKFRIMDQLSETDFGDFENKNYRELAGNPDYQAWIDSGGNLPFPGGESREAFRERTLEGVQKVIAICSRENLQSAALIVHGGTIMTLMEAWGRPKRDFYSWHVKNGHCYMTETDETLWQSGRGVLEVKEEY
ncbi:MAG TPA: histidine phosphatase family protein [Candidatus Blautia intestinipullorum]|nr:histidine phosphatase family protein [Candidatus Blautia intestinipullorum]